MSEQSELRRMSARIEQLERSLNELTIVVSNETQLLGPGEQVTPVRLRAIIRLYAQSYKTESTEVGRMAIVIEKLRAQVAKLEEGLGQFAVQKNWDVVLYRCKGLRFGEFYTEEPWKLAEKYIADARCLADGDK